MSSDDFARQLGELKETAEALNRELDSVNQILEGVEKQLQELNVATEMWLEDSPLRTQELSVSASNVAPNIEVQLGYAPRKVGARVEWRLQLREVEYAPRLTSSGDYHERELMRVHKTANLVDASREDCMQALSQLSTLIERLTEATRKRIQTIRDAKKFLE